MLNATKQLSLTRGLGLSSPLYISVFLMRFSFGLALFTIPIYLPTREFSNLIIGMIAAAYPVAETVLGPFVGVLADRFGRRMWVYVGLALSTVALFAFTLSMSVTYLIVVHAVQGVAAAMIVVSSLAMATDLSDVTTRGREMGIFDFANLGGYVLGIFVAGILMRTHFILAPFYFGSMLAALGAIFAYLKLKEPPYSKSSVLSPLSTIRLLLGDRHAAAMFPIWLAVTTFIGIALTFGPRVGPSPLFTSAVLGGIILILAFTQPYFGHLSDKYGRGKLMMLGMVSLVGLFATVLVMFRRRLPLDLVLPVLAVFGMGSLAFAPAALATLGDFAPKGGRGTTMGIYSVVISLGTIIGPLLGGYLLDRYGFASLFYAGFLIIVGAMALAIIIAGPSLGALKPLPNGS